MVALMVIFFYALPAVAQDSLEMTETYFSKGDLKKSADSAEKVLKENPGNIKAGIILAESLSELKKFSKAISVYKDLITREPDNMELIYRLGVVLEKAEYIANAIAAYKQVIEKKPGHAPAHYRLGLCYARSMDLSEAYAEFRILKKLDNKLANELLPYIQSNK